MNRKVTPLKQCFASNWKGDCLTLSGPRRLPDYRITFINTGHSRSTVRIILPEPVPVCDKIKFLRKSLDKPAVQ